MLEFKESYFSSWLKWHVYRRYRVSQKNKFKGATYILRKTVRSIPQGSLVIDCGANVGEVSEYFLSKGMRVIAFEPDPVALIALISRLGSNLRLRIEPKAVGGQAGRATLYQTSHAFAGNLDNTISSSLVKRDIHGDASIENIEIVDLVQYIQSLEEKVRILKLDIEGYEVEVLESIIDSGIYKNIDLIIVETHERFSKVLEQKTDDLRRRISELGIRNINLDWR
ncbi:FkbM family methyltransferase [Labrys sp. (in: a-proteobacteria)]|uniref:FkbM family methyltransferase n=1 Tax=Labrys sp. (in: a-proteobacteria) TaxID=1917972 RepID=UPI0039E4A451